MEKPLERERVLLVLRNALERRTPRRDGPGVPGEHRRTLPAGRPTRTRCARSRKRSPRIAPTKASVLITGESGTGKELVARAIHRNSPRAEQAVRQGQLRRDSRGADRVRAVRPRQGLVHRRDQGPGRQVRPRRRGTIFLDEIGDMSLKTQAKVLRALQDGEVEPVGAAQDADRRRARRGGDEQEPSRRDIARGASARISTSGSTSCRCDLPPLRERRDGHRAAGAALRRDLLPREQLPLDRPLRLRRSKQLDAAALAGQRARVAQRGRAPDHHDARRDASTSRTCPPGWGSALEASRDAAPTGRWSSRTRASACRSSRTSAERALSRGQAERQRLEHRGHGQGDRDTALQPVQETRSLRHQPGEGRRLTRG